MDHAYVIDIVIDALQGVEIKSTKDNLDKMLGSIQALERIRDEILATPKEAQDNRPAPEEIPDVDVEVTEIGRAD